MNPAAIPRRLPGVGSNVRSRIHGIANFKILRLVFEKQEGRAPDSPQRFLRILAIVLPLVILGALVALEMRSGWAESRILSMVARRAVFSVAQGPSPTLDRPGTGPYDERLGYARLPGLVERLRNSGFQVASQASDSLVLRTFSRLGLDPIYREKNQAGLMILDRTDRPLYDSQYPRRVYPDFTSIPPLVANTVLFIENRQALDPSHPYRNPAVQWERLGHAVLDAGVHTLDRHHPLIGGSTLATQLEKLRHSPQGRTQLIVEKARQMMSASLRAYRNGPATIDAQREIVCDYINSIPLSATRGQGEVIGLEDGLHDWYGEDVNAVNHSLAVPESSMNEKAFERRARSYREVLSLFLALRAPTRYLLENPPALADKTDSYLRVLSQSGLISSRLRDSALRARATVRPRPTPASPEEFAANKASNAIRASLLTRMGMPNEYALDRLDMTVRTTLDGPIQNSVHQFLEGLTTPDAVQAAGLVDDQLLNQGKPASVIYSVTIYEPGRQSNYLRIQTDNFNEPLDINQGTKLQLGSTAKLRTLITYLQIVEEMHRNYAALAPDQLKKISVTPGDNLTKWALDYLSQASDKSLGQMLEAALERTYSGGNGEAFFTAGGLHHFDNFEKSEDFQTFTVSNGFQQSVNLVFVRIMRDIERYYMYRVPGASPAVLENQDDPARQRYLDRFADFEGRTFLRRFYEKYQGQSNGQALETLLSGMVLTPVRAAVVFRSIRPRASVGQFTKFLNAHLPAAVMAREDPQELFDKYGPDKFDLNDRGYLARVHPLELWLLNYREQHGNVTLGEAVAASAAERQSVYQWLRKTRYKHAQDKRIETLLEIDAFEQIHRAWKALGYPFDSLVPSYATSIGVSGDTPHALAELVGILVHDGVYYPDTAISQVQLGEGTPWGTRLVPAPAPGVQVLSPDIARIVRREMMGVVQNGTGWRAKEGFQLADGTILPIGGKTGTGDNRLQEFNAHGGLIGSHVENRTAAFAFFVGDRLYGTVLAFVPGNVSGSYKFTSALAVQILKDLEPRLAPLIASRPKPKAGSLVAMNAHPVK